MLGPAAIEFGSAGPVLAVLAVLSVLSLAMIVTRTLALRGAGGMTGARQTALQALDRGEWDAAAQGFARGTAPADSVGRDAAQALADGVGTRALELRLATGGAAQVEGMSRGLRLLDLIGTVGPLLGLLGTVLGMIQSFRSLELAEGAANASILAGGIWQALLTTAAGLLVAIPALAGAAWLAGRVEAGTQAVEAVIARALAAAVDRPGGPGAGA